MLHTLAGKHSIKIHQIIKKYGKSPKVILMTEEKKEKILTEFLTPNDIIHRSRGFVISYDPIYFKDNLDKPIVKFSIPKTLFVNKCVIIDCKNSDIEIHSVRALDRVRYCYNIKFMKSKNKSLEKYVKIESALNKKQISICKKHYKQWHILHRFQLDKKYLKNHIEANIKASKKI